MFFSSFIILSYHFKCVFLLEQLRRTYVDCQREFCFNKLRCFRFQVIKMASMKMTAFWDVVPCVLNDWLLVWGGII
jgi:hypothetical protein